MRRCLGCSSRVPGSVGAFEIGIPTLENVMFRNSVMLLIVAMLTTSCARLGEWMVAQFNAQAMQDLSLEERSVLSGDHRVSYFFRDGNSPVVLLHGFTADRSMYFALIDELGEERGLIVPDLFIVTLLRGYLRGWM